MKAWKPYALTVLVLGTVLVRAQAPYAAFNVTGPAGGGVVQDAPYSAEVVTTYDRVLPSGEKLQGETNGRVLRDSQGRTRTETDSVSPAGISQKFVAVFINDPVDQSIISLDPRTMTARVSTWRLPAASTTSASNLQLGPAQPAADANASSTQPAATGSPVAGAFPGSPGAASAVLSAANTEDLGIRQMEGLPVTGTRVNRTRPSAVGETQPRTMTTTTWVSADLKVAVLIETEDAQAGHRATKLVNIVRTEPDAALFRIPSGYTVADNRTPK